MDGLSLTIGGTLGAAIVSGLVKIFTSRNQKTTLEPDPLNVRQQYDCITVKECNRRMRELDERMTRLESRLDVGLGKIMDKLSAMDKVGEDRAIALHNRLDPMAERIAKTSGEVDLIKEKMFRSKK